MKTGEMVTKQDIYNMLSYEVKYAKQHKQHMIWVYWHYNTSQIMFADTFADFKEIESLYTKQGFVKDVELSNGWDLSEVARSIGAKEVKRHIFINRQMVMNDETAHYMEPVSMFLADRFNAGNEFVVVQIKCS